MPNIASDARGDHDHPAPQQPGRISFAVVGSAMFQTRLRTVADPGFHELMDIVRGADVGFLNLEAPIREPSAYPTKQYVYTSYVTSEPWVADELSWAGFNLVSLANNHMSDWSPDSIVTNQRVLTGKQIAFSGAGSTLSAARAPGYLDTPHGRVGLISVDSSYEYGQYYQVQMASDPHGDVPGRPGTNGLRWDTYYDLEPDAFARFRDIRDSLGLYREGVETTHLREHQPTQDSFYFRGVTVRRSQQTRISTACRAADLAEILRWVRSTREQVDYLLVSHHNHQAAGADWELPVDFVREFAHAVIDEGADAYIGHGYTPKGVEIRRGRPIFYDVGDFSTQDAAARWHPGDVYERWGLDPQAPPGEFATRREHARAAARDRTGDAQSQSATRGYSAATSQSIVARFEFAGDQLAGIALYPCRPKAHARRHLRNLPTPATGSDANRVLERFARASAHFGTKIEETAGVGHVRLD